MRIDTYIVDRNDRIYVRVEDVDRVDRYRGGTLSKKKNETDLPAKGLSRRGYYFDRRRFRARRVVCAPVRGMIVYVRHVHKYARRPPTLSTLFVVSTSRKRDYQSYFVRRTRRRSIMGGGGPGSIL